MGYLEAICTALVAFQTGAIIEEPYVLPSMPGESMEVREDKPEAQLQQELDAHSRGSGVSCQCMECLYNRWYWKSRYKFSYPQKSNPQSVLDPAVYFQLRGLCPTDRRI